MDQKPTRLRYSADELHGIARALERKEDAEIKAAARMVRLTADVLYEQAAEAEEIARRLLA